MVDSRGWSARHGCRKRLGMPKKGKAAIRAEIQGQGKEVLRGRSAFKRSRKTGHSPAYASTKRPLVKSCRAQVRKAVLADGEEARNLDHDFPGSPSAVPFEDCPYAWEVAEPADEEPAV